MLCLAYMVNEFLANRSKYHTKPHRASAISVVVVIKTKSIRCLLIKYNLKGHVFHSPPTPPSIWLLSLLTGSLLSDLIPQKVIWAHAIGVIISNLLKKMRKPPPLATFHTPICSWSGFPDWVALGMLDLCASFCSGCASNQPGKPLLNAT